MTSRITRLDPLTGLVTRRVLDEAVRTYRAHPQVAEVFTAAQLRAAANLMVASALSGVAGGAVTPRPVGAPVPSDANTGVTQCRDASVRDAYLE